MVAQAPARESPPPLELAPSGDPEVERDVLFDGFVTHPVQVAAVLLLLGRAARHRFYVPPGMVAARVASSDPVVTTSGSGIRLESFSACGGMALRYDVDRGGLDRVPVRHGTTNVDLSGPTRLALTGVHGSEPLHLRISEDPRAAVTFSTLDHTVTEARAMLPQRWVRGFAEAQAAGAGLVERAQVSVSRARRFWRSLPRTDDGSSALQVACSATGDLRLTGDASPSSVPLGGPSRLRLLEPLLRLATSVTLYGPPEASDTGVSVWQLDLADGAVTCALSPTSARAFSGEGGLLRRLAAPEGRGADDAVAALLDERGTGELLDTDVLGAELGVGAARVAAALARLAAAGRLGYDLRERRYFLRELPWRPDLPDALNPRLAAARRLVDAATFTVGDDGRVDVEHGDSHHRVTLRGAGATCTCPWVARHGSSRGPCKHILAVGLRAGGGAV